MEEKSMDTRIIYYYILLFRQLLFTFKPTEFDLKI